MPLLISLAFAQLLPLFAYGAIFGTDDRLALTKRAFPYHLGQSTAVAVLRGVQEPAGQGKLKVLASSFDNFLCPDERFSRDPSIPYACSGFLIAPNLLVTAGHCAVNHGQVENESAGYCEVYDWLFDYHQSADLNGMPEENLFRCKRIIYAVFDEKAPSRDFAIIELERPVNGRPPLAISKDPVKNGESVSMIGYPLGTPMKLSRNARVILNQEDHQQFVTNLDAFEGNSGSPVFNARNEVVGLLVNGTPIASFVKDESRSCSRYNRCDSEGKNCLLPDGDTSKLPHFQVTGSGVQRIQTVLEQLSRGSQN